MPNGAEPSEGEQQSGEYGVLARTSRPGPQAFVLKAGETFGVFDSFGDLRPDESAEQGVYYAGMRHLSRLEFQVWGAGPLLLSSTVRQDNCVLSVHMTNPDITRHDGLILRRGALYLERTAVLAENGCVQRVRLSSYSDQQIVIPIRVLAAADFRDVFQIRGVARTQHGRARPPTFGAGELLFEYDGQDQVLRTTVLRTRPAPERHFVGGVELKYTLGPRATGELEFAFEFKGELPPPKVQVSFERARDAQLEALDRARRSACRISTSHEQFNSWLERSFFDVRMLVTATEYGPFPYAGIPWYSAPFGRDALITALELLWVDPSLARGVLNYLAHTQCQETDPEREAQPGKILHEARLGEMAATDEIPFKKYYGSVDAPALFIYLAGEYFRRTGDLEFIQSIWANIGRALDWIDNYGAAKKDGFIEYRRVAGRGLVNQGWKDSNDSVFHADGSDAPPPIALCEVQAYTYAARRAAARLARTLGENERAVRLEHQADALRRRFLSDFWCPDLNTFALALDGNRNQCRVRSSNAGQTLFSGIATPEQARAVMQTLLAGGSFSGWGIRTLDNSAARYNPMSYHNGSVWPHDNALIALGFAAYGLKRAVLQVMAGVFESCLYMAMHRMPELFCGFARMPEEGPTLYPVACLPQAWASATVFMLLQACLGLSFRLDETPGRVTIELNRPVLPGFLRRVDIQDLRVGEEWIDLVLQNHEGDVGVNIRHRSANLDVIVRK
jgi:glycogen debranching enzyme